MAGLACFVALAVAPLAVAQSTSSPCADELTHFRELLVRFRSGEEGALEPLRASAVQLCTSCSRCDAADVAEHYAGLSPEGLAQGRVDESAYLALREEVFAAGRDAAEWPSTRERVLDELHSLAARARLNPDFVPAAQALSLCARIEVERLESDPTLGPEERSALATEAETVARDANVSFERAGQVTPRLEPEWLLGRIACWRGERAAARASFERCLRSAERVGSDEFREHALLGLLALARGAGDVTEQERLLTELASFRDPRESWPLAREWSARLLLSDHAEAAADFLERHEPRADSHVVDRIEWELLIGSALLRLHEEEEARPHFDRVAQAGASELALLALVRLALDADRPFEARDLLERPELIPALSPLGAREAHAMLGEALLATGDVERAASELAGSLEDARRRREDIALEPLAESALERMPAADAAARSVIGETTSGLHAVALLADARSRLGDPLEAIREIEEAQADTLRRAGEARLGLSSARGAELDPGLAREDVQDWARTFELGLVTWVVGANFAVVGHVAQDGSAWTARIERGREAIRDAARRLREAALSRDPTRLATVAEEVRAELVPDALVERLRSAIESSPRDPAPRVLFLLHGPLEGLPIELLSILGAPLDDVLAAVALPGIPEPEPGVAPEPAALARWRLLGDPLASDGRALLAGAKDELAALLELHPDAIVEARERFDAEALRSALLADEPLHLATHVRALRSGARSLLGASTLLLSGGTSFGADQIAALAPHLPLAVLSACETGGGRFVDAEGLQGLARAFLQSGTRDVLVTGWPVTDRAAASFAREFHRSLGSGDSPARAARRARMSLRASGAPPSDWAAFRLLGRE